MSAGNTAQGYGWVARCFHWSIAILILLGIGLGLYAENLPRDSEGAVAYLFQVFSIHKTIGIAVLFLALARILWAITQPRPHPLHPERRAETWLAEAVHWGLYGGMVVQPLTGWLMNAAAPGGFSRIIWPFGQRLPGIPQDQQLFETFASIHGIGWFVLGGLIALHVAGVLKHSLIDRDATLARMTRGTGDVSEPKTHRRHGKPTAPVAAIAVWTAVLLAGMVATETPQPAAAQTRPAPEAATPAPPVTADGTLWQVTDGSLKIAVIQGTSPVAGEFSTWDATIDFDPETGTGKTEVTIDIASLTLGGVTENAIGPDFLNASAHPKAIFTAAIEPAESGYQAAGTLSLAGVEVPVTLPFTLALDGDTATATGRATLDRRDFKVGAGYADESTVSFAVTVDIYLTAKQR